MPPLAIRVEALGKQYQIGAQAPKHTFREAIEAAVGAPFRRAAALLRGDAYGASGLSEPFWALRDVSFDVEEGEVVGIIGRNGAGKSTLLKILSRITEPTEGRVTMHGRAGSLLEVGTGFHPELTGRENVFLNGAILGMGRREVERKFDEIVAFAEVERFIDTPVKHYSSGMYMRLAFAVAAHLEPDILIVDEVLAVGDAAFQKKCLGKMGDVAREGRTVLFVSHNMVAIESLCRHAILLEAGRIADMGDSHGVVSAYLRQSTALVSERVWDTFADASGVGDAMTRLKRVAILPPPGYDGVVRVDTPLAVEVEFWNFEENADLHVTLTFTTEDGVVAFATPSHNDPAWSDRIGPGVYRSTCAIPPNLLNSGIYSLSVLFMKNATEPIAHESDILSFAVEDNVERRYGWYGKIPGAVYPLLNWTTKALA